MPQRGQAFLNLLLLMSIGLRVVFGAPCCWTGAGAEPAALEAPAHSSMAHAMHGDDDQAEPSGHEDHGEDNRAKPCCSACGPVLPGEPILFQAATKHLAVFTAQRLRDLTPEQPARPYLARAPPSLV